MSGEKPKPRGGYRVVPASPQTTTALLEVFKDHPMERAVREGWFRVGAIACDREVSRQTLADMVANPEASRRLFAGKQGEGS